MLVDGVHEAHQQVLLRRDLRLERPGAARGAPGEPRVEDPSVHDRRLGASGALAVQRDGAEGRRQERAVE